ncbi:MAG: hypothetical protein HYS07_06770 [Chlamydiae bacterium]|nr:hypothetical protein [Chlamydiota bacterium]MBI3276381.1 hypothetical protein [Chlamydiota bacterium]
MTQLLSRVFTKVGKLSEMEQNALAKWLLDELSSEHRWDKAFADSEEMLEKLSNEASREHQKKKTQTLDLDRL